MVRPDRQAPPGPHVSRTGATQNTGTMGLGEAWTAARRAGRAFSSAAQSSGRAGAGAARRTSRGVQRLTGASGARRTGLASLMELTAAGAAGDAFVTIALARPLFFSASLDK